MDGLLAVFKPFKTIANNPQISKPKIEKNVQISNTNIKNNTLEKIATNAINYNTNAENKQDKVNVEQEKPEIPDIRVDFKTAMISALDIGVGSEFVIEDGIINGRADGTGNLGNYKYTGQNEFEVNSIIVTFSNDQQPKSFNNGETYEQIKKLYPNERISFLVAEKNGTAIGFNEESENDIIMRMIDKSIYGLKEYLNPEEMQALIDAKENTGKIDPNIVERVKQIVQGQKQQQKQIDIDYPEL